MKKKKDARRPRVSKGNRSKGERLEVVLAPELMALVQATKGEESFADFVRAAVRERATRLDARRRRAKV